MMLDKHGEEVEACRKCDQYHLTRNGAKSCSGHLSPNNERAGEPCTQPAGFGTDHLGSGDCKFHKGAGPGGIARAKKMKLESQVRKQLGLTSWEPITDPYSALADHAGKGAALEEILHAKVEELASLRQYGGDMGDRIDVIYEAWERAHNRVGNELIAMARLDLDDRIARLQARIDDETANLVRNAMKDATAHLSAEVREDVLKKFGESLRRGEVIEEASATPPALRSGAPRADGLDPWT